MADATLLPLFPLGTVLFPGVALPLRIFEDRYLKMVDRCLEAECGFGIVLIRRGWEVGEAAEPFSVGTLAQIVRVERLAEGTLNLLVVGSSRFRIRHFVAGGPFLQAEVDHLEDNAAGIDAPLVATVRRQYLEYISAVRSMTRQAARQADVPLGALEMSYTVAANLQVTRQEQQQLLEAGPEARLARESDILTRETTLIRRLGAVVSRRTRAPSDIPLN